MQSFLSLSSLHPRGRRLAAESSPSVNVWGCWLNAEEWGGYACFKSAGKQDISALKLNLMSALDAFGCFLWGGKGGIYWTALSSLSVIISSSSFPCASVLCDASCSHSYALVWYYLQLGVHNTVYLLVQWVLGVFLGVSRASGVDIWLYLLHLLTICFLPSVLPWFWLPTSFAMVPPYCPSRQSTCWKWGRVNRLKTDKNICIFKHLQGGKFSYN